MKLGLLTLLTGIAWASSVSAQVSLSDQEAEQVIKNYFSEVQSVSLDLGRYDVMNSNQTAALNQMGKQQYLGVQALAALGYVTIRTIEKGQVQANGRRTMGIGDIFTPDGVIEEKIEVQLASGVEARKYLDGSTLRFPLATLAVERIARNEVIKSGLDDYALVMTVSELDWSEQATASLGFYDMRAKLTALLKHDPFEGAWKLVNWEISTMDEEVDLSFAATIVSGQRKAPDLTYRFSLGRSNIRMAPPSVVGGNANTQSSSTAAPSINSELAALEAAFPLAYSFDELVLEVPMAPSEAWRVLVEVLTNSEETFRLINEATKSLLTDASTQGRFLNRYKRSVMAIVEGADTEARSLIRYKVVLEVPGLDLVGTPGNENYIATRIQIVTDLLKSAYEIP